MIDTKNALKDRAHF